MRIVKHIRLLSKNLHNDDINMLLFNHNSITKTQNEKKS